MPDFIRLTEKYVVQAYFWTYRNCGVQNEKEAREMSIFDKRHRDYNELVKVLHNDIFKSKNSHLNPMLLEISKSNEIKRTKKEEKESKKWHNFSFKNKHCLKYKILKSLYKKMKKINDTLEKSY